MALAGSLIYYSRHPRRQIQISTCSSSQTPTAPTATHPGSLPLISRVTLPGPGPPLTLNLSKIWRVCAAPSLSVTPDLAQRQEERKEVIHNGGMTLAAARISLKGGVVFHRRRELSSVSLVPYGPPKTK
jgi:hypothetical protein